MCQITVRNSCDYLPRSVTQADVFSFGIILCEIIARIDADPEELPRTQVPPHADAESFPGPGAPSSVFQCCNIVELWVGLHSVQ